MNEQAGRPIYLWLERTIKKWIQEGVYNPGDKIPSERDLALETRISRTTVRKAIDHLIDQQFLERRAGSGTYVHASAFVARQVGRERPLGLTERLRQSGSQAHSTLLSFHQELPPEKVAARLGLLPGEHVLKIRRLRAVEALPICIETIYLPCVLAPGLFAEHLANTDASLYQLLEERYHLSPESSMENLRISYATEEEAALLGLRPRDPVLLMRCITFDCQGRPFEYLVSVNHPDRVIFEARSSGLSDMTP